MKNSLARVLAILAIGLGMLISVGLCVIETSLIIAPIYLAFAFDRMVLLALEIVTIPIAITLWAKIESWAELETD